MKPVRILRHHAHTRRDLETGLVVGLGLCLLLGLLPIRVTQRPEKVVRSAESLVIVSDHQLPPRTRQQAGPLPPRPGIGISAPIDAPLADLPLDDLSLEGDTRGMHASVGTWSQAIPGAATRGGTFTASSGPGTPPRQILEVLPEPGNGCDGAVTVQLAIGRDGRVRSHRIRRNSLGEGTCLQRVLTAIYASRWEAFEAHDMRDSVIVRKTYSLD